MAARGTHITGALTDSSHTLAETPPLPGTPDASVQQSWDAVRAAAATVHVPARNPDGGRPAAERRFSDRLVGGAGRLR